MPTGLRGRHKVPKSVYDRNRVVESAEAKAQREARRAAAAAEVAAERRALEARLKAEATDLVVVTQPRRKLIFVKEPPAPPKTRDWNMQDVIYNLRVGYTPEYLAWRTKYPLDQVQAVPDSL